MAMSLLLPVVLNPSLRDVHLTMEESHVKISCPYWTCGMFTPRCIWYQNLTAGKFPAAEKPNSKLTVSVSRTSIENKQLTVLKQTIY